MFDTAAITTSAYNKDIYSFPPVFINRLFDKTHFILLLQIYLLIKTGKDFLYI